MKPLSLIVSTLFLCSIARAEVIVYNQVSVDTFTGQGKTAVTNVTGYLVLDTEGKIFSIEAHPKAKTFQVFDASAVYRVNYVRSSPTKQKLFLSLTANDDTTASAGAMMAKGSVVLVNIGASVPFNIAKTMTVSGFSITGDDPDATVLESKGTLTYNGKATVSANQAGNDVDTVVNGLRAVLISKGFTEE